MLKHSVKCIVHGRHVHIRHFLPVALTGRINEEEVVAAQQTGRVGLEKKLES